MARPERAFGLHEAHQLRGIPGNDVAPSGVSWPTMAPPRESTRITETESFFFTRD